MKRLLSVFMLMLMLVLSSGGNLSGRDRSIGPDNPSGGAPTGDDHPWGGDQSSYHPLITNRAIDFDKAPAIGPVRALVVRIVLWCLLDNVETTAASQRAILDTSGSLSATRRPAGARSSTPNQQGDQR